MQYQVLVERDPDTKAFTATVPGLPIVVDARSRKDALRLVKEGLSLYHDEMKASRRSPNVERPAKAELVTVDL